MGLEMDLRQAVFLRESLGGVRSGRGNILLRVIRGHFLAEEKGINAGIDILKRTYLPGRGDAHGVCLPAILHAAAQTECDVCDANH